MAAGRSGRGPSPRSPPSRRATERRLSGSPRGGERPCGSATGSFRPRGHPGGVHPQRRHPMLSLQTSSTRPSGACSQARPTRGPRSSPERTRTTPPTSAPDCGPPRSKGFAILSLEEGIGKALVRGMAGFWDSRGGQAPRWPACRPGWPSGSGSTRETPLASSIAPRGGSFARVEQVRVRHHERRPSSRLPLSDVERLTADPRLPSLLRGSSRRPGAVEGVRRSRGIPDREPDPPDPGPEPGEAALRPFVASRPAGLARCPALGHPCSRSFGEVDASK